MKQTTQRDKFFYLLFYVLVAMFVYGVGIVGAFFFTVGFCLLSIGIDWWLDRGIK